MPIAIDDLFASRIPSCLPVDIRIRHSRGRQSKSRVYTPTQLLAFHHMTQQAIPELGLLKDNYRRNQAFIWFNDEITAFKAFQQVWKFGYRPSTTRRIRRFHGMLTNHCHYHRLVIASFLDNHQ